MATTDSGGSPAILVSGFPAAATVLNGACNRQTGLWAFSAQSTTPTGYLAEADLAAGTITRTIATGFALLNTVDFSRHDASWYATEFGLPGDPNAAGGTVYRITNAGVVTTVQTGLGIDRVNSIEVGQDGTLVIGSRHNILILAPTGPVLRTLPYQSDRNHAATGVTVYGNNRLQLDTSGGTAPGATVGVKVSVRNPAAAGALYVLGPALYMWPGYGLPNGEILDLVPDALTLFTIAGFLNHMFQNFVGTLDANGEATAAVRIPTTVVPNVNIRIFIAGVVLGPANSVIAVLDTEAFTVRTP